MNANKKDRQNGSERPLKTRLKELAWPHIRKPWDSPTMEFDYGLWHGLSALMSESGRQLGEENTRPSHLNLRISADVAACNFEGSRNGKSINLSALRIAMKHFDEALVICDAVRHVHTKHMPETQAPALGIWDIYIISRSCLALVAFMKRSPAQAEPMGDVPDVLASIYQFVSGLFMIGRDMIQTAHPAVMENRQLSAQELYDYASEKRIFESPNGMVCAGSTRKIIEFLEIFDLGVQGSWPAPTCDLSGLVNNVDDWHKYAITTIEMEWFVARVRLKNEIAEQSEDAAHKQSVLKIYEDISHYMTDLFALSVPTRNMSEEEAARTRQNQILALLGRPDVSHLKRAMVKKQFAFS